MATEEPRQPGSSADRGLLELAGVGYAYPDGTRALGGVELRADGGQVIGIVGPSGCGKSTLLALLAGLKRPQEGTVAWNWPVVAGDGPKLTLVFQNDTVLPWLTVEKNVGFGLRYVKMTKEAKTERVAALLSMAGLADAGKLLPYQLSGGMRRRVAFLTGVAPEPAVLLLDEPFAALDEPTRLAIHQDVLDTVRRLGMTVILVTHDLAEAITLSDRVYVLSRRPATVASAHDVPFGRDRDVLALRESVEYHDFYRLLWHDLRLEIAKQQQLQPA